MKTVVTIFTFLLAFTGMQAQELGTITLKVEGASSDEGKILAAMYNSEATFFKKRFKGGVLKIEKGQAVITWDSIPKGMYAISIFHDENDNDKLDSNFMGIPKEDYGASNNAKGFMGPPKWEDAKFSVSGGEQEVTINLRD